MQWTPYDVKVMEHMQRIEQATWLGWITDLPRSHTIGIADRVRQHITTVVTLLARMRTTATTRARSVLQHS